MSRKVTDKKPLFSQTRSHAMNATKHKQNLNLQTVVMPNGEKLRMTVREAKKFKKDDKSNINVEAEIVEE